MKLEHPSDDGTPSARGGYPALTFQPTRPMHTVPPIYTIKKTSSYHRFAEVLSRRKKLAVGIFLAPVIVAFLWTVLSTPIYRASATIEIEKDPGISLSQVLTSISSSITGGIESVANEDVSTEMSILKSRVLAERLADQLKLSEKPEFCQPSLMAKTRNLFSGMMPARLIAHSQESALTAREARDRLIQEVMNRIRVARDGRSRLMTVTIESESPELAQKMLETYVDIYFGENLAKRRRANVQASLWLVDEVKKAEKKARSALDAVVDFAAKYDMVSFDVDSPTSHANHKLAIFNKTAEDLVKTKEARILLESLYRVSGGDLLALPPELKSTQLETLENRLADMQASYAEASKIYSQNYPTLLLQKKQIAVLKGQTAKTQRQIMSTMVAGARQKEVLHEEALEQAKSEALKSNSLGVQYAILKKTADTT
jgi:succinoglycan biosynthesis transport protein ExoP